MKQQHNHQRLLIAAGILLGISFAGLFDGIVLHQILQWHHMLTSVEPATNIGNLELNTLWDGLFNLITCGMNIAGLVLLWRAGQLGDFVGASRKFTGSLLAGAGSFNVLEGLLNHHILGIHHVKSGANQLAWDLGFLALSTILAVFGLILLRNGQQDAATIKN
ncbi:MAG TPA: DUF2243 domain-containing protein [Cyanobacteria bacterium UBA8803]|nr:DUF2243 domain-containing protein [Cyanobacteria bacterium UBA9273]HBL62797.1 DUF2243 domain-containing protein [Cyanobacteria bacterium UBA8803]